MKMRRVPTVLVTAMLALSVCTTTAAPQAVQPGTVSDPVQCASDAAQSYALFLPSSYSPDRTWTVLFAFHPAARGRLMVEKYQAAAEQYGVIVAASNNSRNGPHAVSAAAAQAMSVDVSRRFSIDPQRVYLTGMSGGARVALTLALSGNNIAGVIASSAGYPDSQPRATVPFALFSTTGTEDFNYLEMRVLDRTLTSPHFLAVFQGGHTLPPNDVAFEAVEWMELQAMQSGRRSRDQKIAATILEKRRARIVASTSPAETVYLLQTLVSDFNGLLDVSAEAHRLEDMSRRSDVKKALKRERESDDAEARILQEIFDLERQLGDDRRDAALMTVRDQLSRLSRTAASQADTPKRNQARRVLRAIAAGASERVQDRGYLVLVEQYRLQGR